MKNCVFEGKLIEPLVYDFQKRSVEFHLRYFKDYDFNPFTGKLEKKIISKKFIAYNNIAITMSKSLVVGDEITVFFSTQKQSTLKNKVSTTHNYVFVVNDYIYGILKNFSSE